MTNFDKTFIHGSSPNFSDALDGDENSENNVFSTLQITNTYLENNNNNIGKEKSIKKTNNNTLNVTQIPQPHGRNTFAFWTIVISLIILSTGNLILTVTIIGVLHLGKGMESLELIPEDNAIKFFGTADLDRIYKRDGIIEGFADIPISISGENSDVRINIYKANGHIRNKMLMTKNGTQFDGINQFEIKNPHTNDVIFSTHKPHYNLPNGVDNLNVKSISASCVTSPIDESLNINNTRGKMLFRGTEGIAIESKEIHLSADQNIHFKSLNGTITLSALLGGVFVDMRTIPIAGEGGVKIEQEQYKICVCMPQGKLFRVLVPPGPHATKGICNHYNPKYDPCSI